MYNNNNNNNNNNNDNKKRFAKMETSSPNEVKENKLLEAIMLDDDKTAIQLLKNGLDPNFSTSDLIHGKTAPLHSAVRRNNLKIVRSLLEHGANVNVIDHDGETPLFSALSSDIVGRMRHLLYDHGADTNIINKTGQTVLLNVLENSSKGFEFHREAVFELLEKSQGPFEVEYLQSLMQLVSSVHPKETGEDDALNSENHNCVKFLQWILRRCDQFKKQGETGKTILHSIASVCCHESLEFLSQNGIQVDATIKDINGQTALHHLSYNPHYTGFCKCLDWFMEKSFMDINAFDCYGRTVFHYVCNSEHANTRAVNALIHRGANIKVTDKKDLNMLHMCVLPVFINTMNFLTFPENEIPDKPNADDVIELLVSSGLDIDTADKAGFTALHHSIRATDVNVIGKLLSLGADPNLKTKTGETAVHRATLYQEIFETLLKFTMHDLNINEQDNFGATPLHWAIIYLEKPAAQMLLDIGANIEINDNVGNSAPDVARSRNFTSFFDMFQIIDGSNSNDSKMTTSTEHLDNLSTVEYCQDDNVKRVEDKVGEGSIPKTMQEGADNWWYVETEEYYETDSDDEDEDLVDVCQNGEDVFPICERLRTIYTYQKKINHKTWSRHMLKHKNGLKNFVQWFVLDSIHMGLYFDTDENSQIAKTVENVMKRISTRISNVNTNLTCEVTISGSWAEGTKVTHPSEFDYKWTLVNFQKHFIPEITDQQFKGYAKLKLRNKATQDRGMLKYVDSEGYLDSRKVIRELYGAINEALFQEDFTFDNLYLTKHLPVDKGSIDHLSFRWVGMFYKDFLIDVDIVPAVVPLHWKPTSVNLESQLGKTYFKDVEQSLVFKTPSSTVSPNWNKFFRISMAEYETAILQNVPYAVKKGYILLKSIKDTLYIPQVYDKHIDYLTQPYLTTYVLKTCFLHELEKAIQDPQDISLDLPKDLISKEVTLNWAHRILERLESSISQSKLASFFVRDTNLIIQDEIGIFDNKHILKAELFCLFDLMAIVANDK